MSCSSYHDELQQSFYEDYCEQQMDDLIGQMSSVGVDDSSAGVDGEMDDLIGQMSSVEIEIDETPPLEEKIRIICHTDKFNDEFIEQIMDDPDWPELIFHFAYRIGELGDEKLYEIILCAYEESRNMRLLEEVFLGASTRGDASFHLAKQVVNDYYDINRPDIIFNIFASNNDKAIYNLFKLGVDNEGAVLFAAGATKKAEYIKNLITNTEADILMPLRGAIQNDNVVVVEYYCQNMDQKTLSQFIELGLEYNSFNSLDVLCKYDMDALDLFEDDSCPHELLIPLQEYKHHRNADNV